MKKTLSRCQFAASLLMAVIAVSTVGCNKDASHQDLPTGHVTKISKLANLNGKIRPGMAAGAGKTPPTTTPTDPSSAPAGGTK
jgi:hypothetical protein